MANPRCGVAIYCIIRKGEAFVTTWLIDKVIWDPVVWVDFDFEQILEGLEFTEQDYVGLSFFLRHKELTEHFSNYKAKPADEIWRYVKERYLPNVLGRQVKMLMKSKDHPTLQTASPTAIFYRSMISDATVVQMATDKLEV